MSNQPSAVLSTAPAVTASAPAPASDAGKSLSLEALAPDLVALFLGARPHPDIVIPQPQVTVAGLAAAARAASADPASATVRWDGPGQRLKP